MGLVFLEMLHLCTLYRSVDMHSIQMLYTLVNRSFDVVIFCFPDFVSTVLMQKKQSRIMKRKTRQGKALEKRTARSFMDVLQEVSNLVL
jgi:hypothetical protein